MACDCYAQVLAEIADLKAMVARLLPAPEPEPEPETRPPLLQALADAFGDACFTSGDAWRGAMGDAGLSDALRAEGITGPHGIGRRLADYQGQGVQRIGLDHGSSLWRVSS